MNEFDYSSKYWAHWNLDLMMVLEEILRDHQNYYNSF